MICRPCVLGFAALALAITLWGFGYKLSLYQPKAMTRCLTAKFWDKHQSVEVPRSAVSRPVADTVDAGPHVFVPPDASLRRATFDEGARRCDSLLAALFAYRRPLRSPPSHSHQA